MDFYMNNRKHIMLAMVLAVSLAGVGHEARAASPSDYAPDPVSQSHVWGAGAVQSFSRQDGTKDKAIHGDYTVTTLSLGYQHMTEFFGNPMRLSVSLPFKLISERSSYTSGRSTYGTGDIGLDALLWLISEPEVDQNLGIRLAVSPANGDYRPSSLDVNTGSGHVTARLEIGYRYGIMGADRPILTLEPILGGSIYTSQETYLNGPRLTTAPTIEPQFFLSSRPFDDLKNLEFFGGGGAQLGGDLKYEGGKTVKGSNEIYLTLGARGDVLDNKISLRGDARIVVGHDKTTPYAPGSSFAFKGGYRF